MTVNDPFDEIEAFYEPYRKAVYECDIEAIDKMFDYPFILCDADGSREVHNSDLYRKTCEYLRSIDSAGSHFDTFRKMRMGKDGAAVMLSYTRYRHDGSTIRTGRATYFLRHGADGWKFVGMIDEFGD